MGTECQQQGAIGRNAQQAAVSPPPSLKSCSERTQPVTPSSPLERISLELSRQCNLQCRYCYSEAQLRSADGLSDCELKQIVEEAVALGARLISIVAGGEPLLRPSMTRASESLIDVANERGCYCYLYTNCTKVTNNVAQFLASRDVSVVGKFNSLRDNVQDRLVGVAGSSKLIRRGIDALLEAGFAAENPSKIALESIICPSNYEEIPEMWRYMRSRNIIPELEIPTLHGRAVANLGEIAFPASEASQKYEALFNELSRIDREYYGFFWEPHPPFPAASCRLFENNCYISAEGRVQPCAGVDRALGYLRVGSHGKTGHALAEIVKLPEFAALRDVRRRIAEPCRNCALSKDCYGCRGAAFHATGDMFAADPVCWHPRGARAKTDGPLAQATLANP
jgi:radical SAM protein with 4Fe4S-binding SPASM domain